MECGRGTAARGKKQMACADGYRLENTGNVCYEDDCTTAYDYHCIACHPASLAWGTSMRKARTTAARTTSLLILIICLPIGVVLICICIGCCICHRRRQAQQRQAPAAANAQMAHVQMAPVPTSYAYNTQQRAEEMYKQIAAWYGPENAALRATGVVPNPTSADLAGLRRGDQRIPRPGRRRRSSSPSSRASSFRRRRLLSCRRMRRPGRRRCRGRRRRRRCRRRRRLAAARGASRRPGPGPVLRSVRRQPRGGRGG